ISFVSFIFITCHPPSLNLYSFPTRRSSDLQDISPELEPDLPLEIAHLLLIDAVGYSKLLVNEQIKLLQELNQIVRSTECFRTARSEEHTSELQSLAYLVCRLLLEKKKTKKI